MKIEVNDEAIEKRATAFLTRLVVRCVTDELDALLAKERDAASGYLNNQAHDDTISGVLKDADFFGEYTKMREGPLVSFVNAAASDLLQKMRDMIAERVTLFLNTLREDGKCS